MRIIPGDVRADAALLMPPIHALALSLELGVLRRCPLYVRGETYAWTNLAIPASRSSA